MNRLISALAFALLLAAPEVWAIELGLPIECEMGKDCFIQNYVDTSPGEAYADYQCHSLSYDKHDGVDFRLRNYVEMRKGIPVIAAADGVVIGARDEMEDVNVNNITLASIRNRECGNGVVIEHGDGWQTQYCHMKRRSIRVKKGDAISKGALLGFVGLSGKTEFPHLHFAVRKNGKKLDPFTGKEMETACDAIEPVSGLWSKEAAAKLPYTPTTLLGAGFSTEKPEAEDIRNGKGIATTISLETPAIILWADIMGPKKDDILLMEILDPEGRVMHSYQKNFEKNQAQYFLYTGKSSRTTSKWAEGIYTGKITLLRKNGEKNVAVISEVTELYVR